MKPSPLSLRSREALTIEDRFDLSASSPGLLSASSSTDNLWNSGSLGREQHFPFLPSPAASENTGSPSENAGRPLSKVASTASLRALQFLQAQFLWACKAVQVQQSASDSICRSSSRCQYSYASHMAHEFHIAASSSGGSMPSFAQGSDMQGPSQEKCICNPTHPLCKTCTAVQERAQSDQASAPCMLRSA